MFLNLFFFYFMNKTKYLHQASSSLSKAWTLQPLIKKVNWDLLLASFWPSGVASHFLLHWNVWKVKISYLSMKCVEKIQIKLIQLPFYTLRNVSTGICTFPHCLVHTFLHFVSNVSMSISNFLLWRYTFWNYWSFDTELRNVTDISV